MSTQHGSSSAPLGVFDNVPSELVLTILQILESNNAVSFASTCHALYDNREIWRGLLSMTWTRMGTVFIHQELEPLSIEQLRPLVQRPQRFETGLSTDGVLSKVNLVAFDLPKDSASFRATGVSHSGRWLFTTALRPSPSGRNQIDAAGLLSVWDLLPLVWDRSRKLVAAATCTLRKSSWIAIDPKLFCASGPEPSSLILVAGEAPMGSDEYIVSITKFTLDPDVGVPTLAVLREIRLRASGIELIQMPFVVFTLKEPFANPFRIWNVIRGEYAGDYCRISRKIVSLHTTNGPSRTENLIKGYLTGRTSSWLVYAQPKFAAHPVPAVDELAVPTVIKARRMPFNGSLEPQIFHVSSESVPNPRAFIVSEHFLMKTHHVRVIDNIWDPNSERRKLKIPKVESIRPVCRTVGGHAVLTASRVNVGRPRPVLLLLNTRKLKSSMHTLPLTVTEKSGLQVLVCPVTGFVLGFRGSDHLLWDISKTTRSDV